jgi:hypothetical protein
MYPPCDIDKVRERGETWAVDPEMREALDRLGADLRGEIRAGDAETRAYVGERFQTSESGMRAYIGERFQTSESGMRAYIGERFQTSESGMHAYIDERFQTSESGMRAYIDERFQTSESGMRAYIGERLEVNTGSLLHEMRESESRTRRYFDVVGESLRGEIRGVAELVALSNEGSKRRDDELAGRIEGLEGRVVRLEVRVLSLEDNRKPRRPPRRR